MTATETTWLQVTSGRGPAECQLAVAHLLVVIRREAESLGLAAEIIAAEPGEGAGMLLSGLIAVSGAGAAGFATRWQGSVQWIARSPVRPNHKRRNWFAGVTALLPPAASDHLDPRDVTYEAMRAGGPGGQHVNKTESAVRARHGPTGLSVVAREERSQAMNRRLALARLGQLIAARAEAATAASEAALWERHDQLERGNPVRVFEGEAFRERRRG
jgi:peptide chain release factor